MSERQTPKNQRFGQTSDFPNKNYPLWEREKKLALFFKAARFGRNVARANNGGFRC